jgi:hypothetical protein
MTLATALPMMTAAPAPFQGRPDTPRRHLAPARWREQVARALVRKGVRLGQLGRPEEELGAYDQVVARFGDAAEPGVREQVATALVYKGTTLGQLGRPEEELGAYAQVVARFGDAAEPQVREQVATALVY